MSSTAPAVTVRVLPDPSSDGATRGRQLFAALYCSTISPFSRPRALTSTPLSCAQARTAFGSTAMAHNDRDPRGEDLERATATTLIPPRC